MKTQNVNELEMTDGKNRDVQMELGLNGPETAANEPESKSKGEVAKNEQMAQIKDLEDLLQIGKMNPYGTNDKTTFARRINSMDLDTMRHLAMQVGVQPISNSTKMRERLLESFQSFVNSTRSVVGPVIPSIDPNSEAYESIKDFLY